MNPSSTLYFLLLSTNAVCFSNLISLNLRLRKINVPIKSNPTMFPSSYYYADENISAFPTSEATEYPSVVVESPFESANDNTTTSIPSENSTESPSPSVNASSNLSLPMVPPKVKATPKKSTHDQTETTVTFMASEAKSFDHFGHVVVTDETNIFISTYTWRKSSAVHVEGIDKTSSNSTQWIEESRLPLPGSFPLSEFGAGLAAANGSLIVASPYDSSATRNAGSITVYKKGPVGYKPVQTISPKIPLALYGFSVAAHDELLAISAPGEKSKRSEHSGRVYIYSYNSALKK